MKILLTFCLLGAFAWGSSILGYNIYNKHGLVDIVFTFDTPYEGTLRQNTQGNTITIKLDGASIGAVMEKEIASDYLQNLQLIPSEKEVQVIATVTNGVVLLASKTSDSYGLRLRFTVPISSNANMQQNSFFSNAFLGQLTVALGAFLLVGIALIAYLKRTPKKPIAPTSTFTQSKWSDIDPANLESITPSTPLSKDSTPDELHIRFQKTLDPLHSVAMLDYGTQSYLVLLGNNALLLDKYHENIPVTELEFETLLRTKHHELDHFFQLTSTQDDSFDSYKEKASGID
jgi:hypothetical protein